MTRTAYGLDLGSIDPDWETRAACRNGGEIKDPDAWFVITVSKKLKNLDNVRALGICQHKCPVIEDCRRKKEQLQEKYPMVGVIWAGTWYDTGGNEHLTAEG
jgi:hypothetical protein